MFFSGIVLVPSPVWDCVIFVEKKKVKENGT